MPIVVPVKLKYAAHDLWFSPDSLDIHEGDHVLVSTERGTEIGLVTRPQFEAPEEELFSPLKPVLRIATDEDLAIAEELSCKAEEAQRDFRELVSTHKLEMKPIAVEFLFGGEKAVFYFTADERVDFRELVRDLASTFKMRVDMRQIGVRDEARIVGGYAHCGQELCCARMGKEFEPVSIRMAKEQDLPLNPVKISGVCGRLMCCLRYEFEAYKDYKKRAPTRNAVIDTPLGKAKIVEYNTPKETMVLRLEDGRRISVPLDTMQCCKTSDSGTSEGGCGCPHKSGVASDSESAGGGCACGAGCHMPRVTELIDELTGETKKVYERPNYVPMDALRNLAEEDTSLALILSQYDTEQANHELSAQDDLFSAENNQGRKRRERSNRSPRSQGDGRSSSQATDSRQHDAQGRSHCASAERSQGSGDESRRRRSSDRVRGQSNDRAQNNRPIQGADDTASRGPQRRVRRTHTARSQERDQSVCVSTNTQADAQKQGHESTQGVAGGAHNNATATGSRSDSANTENSRRRRAQRPARRRHEQGSESSHRTGGVQSAEGTHKASDAQGSQGSINSPGPEGARRVARTRRVRRPGDGGGVSTQNTSKADTRRDSRARKTRVRKEDSTE